MCPRKETARFHRLAKGQKRIFPGDLCSKFIEDIHLKGGPCLAARLMKSRHLPRAWWLRIDDRNSRYDSGTWVPGVWTLVPNVQSSIWSGENCKRGSGLVPTLRFPRVVSSLVFILRSLQTRDLAGPHSENSADKAPYWSLL